MLVGALLGEMSEEGTEAEGDEGGEGDSSSIISTSGSESELPVRSITSSRTLSLAAFSASSLCATAPDVDAHTSSSRARRSAACGCERRHQYP